MFTPLLWRKSKYSSSGESSLGKYNSEEDYLLGSGLLCLPSGARLNTREFQISSETGVDGSGMIG